MHLFMYGALICTFFVLRKNKIKITRVFTVFAVSVCYGAAFFLFDKGLLYYRLTIMFEWIISVVMIFVFISAANALKDGRPKRVLRDEEILSVSFTALVIVMGFTDVSVAGIYIRNISIILISLIFAYAGGSTVGCGVGLALGFGTVLTGGEPFIMANIAAGAFVAGLLCRTKKIFVCGGFILANALMTFYTNYSAEVIIPLTDTAIACGIFLLLPSRVHEYAACMIDANISRKRAYENNLERINELTKERLTEISGVFKGIAEVFMKKCDYSDDKMCF